MSLHNLAYNAVIKNHAVHLYNIKIGEKYGYIEKDGTITCLGKLLHLFTFQTPINSQYLTYFRFYCLIRKHLKVIFSFALHKEKRLPHFFLNSFFNNCLVVLFSYFSASKS